MKYTELIKKLQPGDILVYNSRSLFGWLISFKTWHSVTHVEIYAGNEQAIGARVKDGVDLYRIETKDLIGVYRPNVPFDFQEGLKWFVGYARGQKYDWKGILGFIKVVDGGDRSKQFCSELATRFCRHEGFDPFPGDDADKVAPFQFTVCPILNSVWRKSS